MIKQRIDMRKFYRKDLLSSAFFSKYNYTTPTLVDFSIIEKIAKQNNLSCVISRTEDKYRLFGFERTLFSGNIKTDKYIVYPDNPYFTIWHTADKTVAAVTIPKWKVPFAGNPDTSGRIRQAFSTKEPWLDQSLSAVLSEEAKVKVYAKLQAVSHMSSTELKQISFSKEPSNLGIWMYKFPVDNKIIQLSGFAEYYWLTIESAEFEEVEEFYKKYFDN